MVVRSVRANRHGATQLLIPILLAFAGLAVGLALAYFFSSCPIPGGVTSDVTTYLADDDVCGPDVAEIAIRPPDIVVPVTSDQPVTFEVEALAYRSDGGGIPPECDLDLKWDGTSPITAGGIAGNRAQVMIPVSSFDDDDLPFPGQVQAWPAARPYISASAHINIVGESPLTWDSVRADYDGTVSVALLDGKAAGSFWSGSADLHYDTLPVSFVSVGRLRDIGELSPQSFRAAAVFSSNRAARYESLAAPAWYWNEDQVDVVDLTNAAIDLAPIELAVWIALDENTDLDPLSLADARLAAQGDVLADVAWANAVYKNERVGLQLDADIVIIGDDDNDLQGILEPLSGVNGGPNTVDDYKDLAAYNEKKINVYVVGRPWGYGQYDATADRAPIIIISWIPSYRPDPSTLAHEAGHALGLEHADPNLANDNLMVGLLSEWRSRLSVGQLLLMNFAESSWAATLPQRTVIQTVYPPSWDVGIGR
ncbi:MAG: hypothetical protein JSW71_06775 [Gemmatimonadota bacterium]|nr:MAG: hypothetical protein JSW71_06775 [Gemmatimonadota bacterium]